MTTTRITRPMTERELQRHVVDQARSLGWGVTLSARRSMLEEAAGYGVEPPPLDGLVFHPQYSLGSEPGWPDLTLIRRRDRRLIFAELKSDRGQLSPRQAEVLELLRLFAGDRPICGEGPHGDPRTWANGIEPRLACCPSWIQVFVWRPSDVDTIAELLR